MTPDTSRSASLWHELSRQLNALGLIAVSVVLGFAFYDQLVGGDLPCPLCLLQRAGFVGVGVGLALNLRFGARPSHYGIAIVSAMIGAAISVRQVLLHIVPGTGAYGDPFLGLHFYSWALLLFIVIIGGCALLLLVDRQFEAVPPRYRLSGLALAAVALIALLALGNGVSTVLECAGGLCPDNPTSYMLLDRAPPVP